LEDRYQPPVRGRPARDGAKSDGTSFARLVFLVINQRTGLVERMLAARGAMIMIIAVLCAIVVAHDLFRIWEDRNRLLEDTGRQATNLVWAASEHAETAFRLADVTLIDLVDRVVREGTGPDQRERLRRLMRLQQTSGTALLSLAIIDETGALVVDGGPVPRQATYTDRAYFQYHLTHTDRRVHSDGLLRSRLTDKWVVALSRRIDHEDGSFAGVVTAAIDVAYFQNFYASFDLGRDGSVELYLDDGTILIRQPVMASAIGRKLLTLAPFRDADPAPTGTFGMPSPLDSVQRIYAWRRVGIYPFVVELAFGGNEQLAVWRTGAAEHLLATVSATVLLAFVGIRLVAQVRRLTRAERETAAATAESETSAARYRLIADNASDMIVTIDPEFAHRYISPGCRELLGYEPEELIAETPLSLVHPEDVERVTTCVRGMLAGRDRDMLIYRLRHRDGRWVWAEVSLRLVRDTDTGAPSEICLALRDVTQRLAAETALRDRDRELERSNGDLRELKALSSASQHARGLLEASLDPMVTISAVGAITDVNEATVQVTGISRENLIGSDFSNHFTEPARARAGYQRVFAEGSVRDYPLTIPHEDGTVTEVLYNASVYKDADGVVLGVFAAARDVTAQVRAEAEIAEQRVGERDRVEELERLQGLTIARELEMIELKKQIEKLKAPMRGPIAAG
jgi:PAS domain S-box-containing protein